MELTTELRNGDLAGLAGLLTANQLHKQDAVAPATAIRSGDGIITVDGMGLDGPAGLPGRFAPTDIMVGSIADKLKVPVAYLRRLQADRPDLFDANVNGWLHGANYLSPWVMADDHDPRSFLVRTFIDPDGGTGIGRALLSDSFKAVDNLDVLMAALEGAKNGGPEVVVDSADLSEHRMVVKLTAPEITALAPWVLGDYRSPFTGRSGKDVPVVSAGIIITNSETGGSSFTVCPRFVFKVCNNGMCITKDAMRSIHLGGKLTAGIQWSGDTMDKNVELVIAQARDAVATFLNVDYMTAKLQEITMKAGAPVASPVATVQLVGQKLRYSEAQVNGILDHFIKGGSITAGGVMQAVTSYSQLVTNPDEAFDLEMSAINALDAAYTARNAAPVPA
jgi:hypothetical protein